MVKRGNYSHMQGISKIKKLFENSKKCNIIPTSITTLRTL
jgi:hypothetical protein